jgi:hypothetical protein
MSHSFASVVEISLSSSLCVHRSWAKKNSNACSGHMAAAVSGPSPGVTAPGCRASHFRDPIPIGVPAYHQQLRNMQ